MAAVPIRSAYKQTHAEGIRKLDFPPDFLEKMPSNSLMDIWSYRVTVLDPNLYH